MGLVTKVRRATSATSATVDAHGKKASKSVHCLRFSLAVRTYMLVLGGVMAAMAIMIIVLAALNISDASEACEDGSSYIVGGDEEGTCKFAVDSGISFMAMAICCLFLSALTVSAELRARCVARHFGFLCYPTGKGIFLLICGTILASLGRYFKVSGSNVGAAAAELALFIAGMMHLGGGALQLCFGCCFPITPLRREFEDYAAGLRLLRGQQGDASSATTEQVSVAVDAPSKEEPAGAKKQAEEPAKPEEEEVNPFKQRDPQAAPARTSDAAEGPKGVSGIYQDPVGDENPFRKPRPANE